MRASALNQVLDFTSKALSWDAPAASLWLLSELGSGLSPKPGHTIKVPSHGYLENLLRLIFPTALSLVDFFVKWGLRIPLASKCYHSNICLNSSIRGGRDASQTEKSLFRLWLISVPMERGNSRLITSSFLMVISLKSTGVENNEHNLTCLC